MSKRMIACFSIVLAGFLTTNAQADQYTEAVTKHAETVAKGWVNDPAIVSAVKAQNTANAGLSQADIDGLDKQWRAEVSSATKPLIDKVMGNTLSTFLKGKLDSSKGVYTEIFVMDNRGLNVGQSGITSDYWQGDEPKWQETFSKGADSKHISEVEQDESTQTYQSQLSLPIVDPDTRAAIGAITIGINVEAL